MDKYCEYINKLNWSNPKEIQNEGVRFLTSSKNWDFSQCISNSPKEVWCNLIKVIESRNRKDKTELIDELLFLLKDLTWPGALKAYKILLTLDKDIMLEKLELCLFKAYLEKDTVWIANLKMLIKQLGFNANEFSSINLSEILSIAEW